MTALTFPTLTPAPAQIMRGTGLLAQFGPTLARFGRRPLLVGGTQTLALAESFLGDALAGLAVTPVPYETDCSETAIARIQTTIHDHQADVIVGIGGGKALDLAKLLAFQRRLPVVTVPTSGATCAAWTALSNVYSDRGAFAYDVPLDRCPDLLVLDYDLIATAPRRTLVAGIGDALAKWYEASISSGDSRQTLIISAVQQARVLRDLLFQLAPVALAEPGGETWREVVDATVLMAGMIGGLGGAQCRTVAAHAVHNGLTHLEASHGTLHGEKVAYGILVQLRLEEMGPGKPLATTTRQQLLQFYDQIGLPTRLDDLGLGQVSLAELRHSAEIACRPGSDIHHLPFEVTPEALVGAMVSTTVNGPRSATVAPTTAAPEVTAAEAFI
ncbi:MAG: iron-containing alcohol dehydrogenase family protein [Leptolyngbya sp. RL_3_1]|nr:iron-containing alcohol dehydrogenase family protein [Leptolyngbya sp. RL_3_1]